MKEQATAPEMWAVPQWDALLITLVACALCAYTVTWVARAAVKNQPKLGAWFLRMVSAVVGAVSGWLLAGIPWGPIIGFGSGSLTTAVVASVKAKLAGKKAAEE